jgi:hypothetical protein
MKFLMTFFVALFALAPVPAWSLGVVASASGLMADV